MPKKSEKNKAKKPEIQIVDQQKEPCLRALQKKVRNINKKLNEIQELQNKQNLKPEQLQKIQRKDGLVQEKEKFLQFITVYQEIAQQNAKIIRNNQLNELKQIATVLAAREYGAHLKLPENQDLNYLVKILSTPSSSDLTLSQRVQQINQQLTKVANNTNLKKTYLNFVAQNADLILVNQNYSNQPEPGSNRSEQNREEVIHDIDEELHQIDEITGEQHIIVEPHLVDINNENKNIIESEPLSAPIAEEKTSLPVQEASLSEKVEEKPEKALNEQNPVKGERVKRQYNKDQDKDGRKGRRGNYYNKNKDFNEGKKTFVPKYQKNYKKDKEAKDNDDQSSSSSSSPQVRQFKREERKRLQDDGFIFVDSKKPKPKARDQKQWHDKQHGKKHHHHHGPKNS